MHDLGNDFTGMFPYAARYLVRQRIHVHVSVFPAALKATPVSVCVVPRVGTTTLVVSRPTGSHDASGFRALCNSTFLVSGVVNWGVVEVASAGKYQGQFGSCRAFSARQRSTCTYFILKTIDCDPRLVSREAQQL